MALYHKWDVKNDFVYVLTFFSLISDGLGSLLLLGRQMASTKLLSNAASKDIWLYCEHYERWIMAISNKGTNVSDRFRAYARLAGKNPSNGYPNKLVAPLSGTKKMKNLEQRRTKQQFSWEMNLQHSTFIPYQKDHTFL